MASEAFYLSYSVLLLFPTYLDMEMHLIIWTLYVFPMTSLIRCVIDKCTIMTTLHKMYFLWNQEASEPDFLALYKFNVEVYILSVRNESISFPSKTLWPIKPDLSEPNLRELSFPPAIPGTRLPGTLSICCIQILVL